MELKQDVCAGLTEEMRAFKIDKVISRKAIERLLEEFRGDFKRPVWVVIKYIKQGGDRGLSLSLGMH